MRLPLLALLLLLTVFLWTAGCSAPHGLGRNPSGLRDGGQSQVENAFENATSNRSPSLNQEGFHLSLRRGEQRTEPLRTEPGPDAIRVNAPTTNQPEALPAPVPDPSAGTVGVPDTGQILVLESSTPITRPTDPIERLGPLVWGVTGVRGYILGSRTAPNGVNYQALFSLDLDFNLWLCRRLGVYMFNDSRFWGQRAAPGITNPSQGVFDFSKRELDETIGLAWNYYGNFELRGFAYSFNNLNRGSSAAQPTGFKDGAGLENRWYVGGSYPNLGRPGFDVARATFLSVGYYPTKELVDMDGNGFKPGPFARAYLTLDLFGPRSYLYSDIQLVGERDLRARILSIDVGVAVRPFSRVPYLEFRLGSEDVYDFHLHECAQTLYGAVRFIY
jgi:hypothetical protein